MSPFRPVKLRPQVHITLGALRIACDRLNGCQQFGRRQASSSELFVVVVVVLSGILKCGQG